MYDDVYFRELDGRLLLGGGRHIDRKNEITTEIKNTDKIINYLKELASNVILPDINYEIEEIWSGILGFDKDFTQYTPIVKQKNDNIYIAGRFCGMGVALSSTIGELLCKKIYK